jgi:hypothetical protein
MAGEPGPWLRCSTASDACALACYDFERDHIDYLFRSRLRPDLDDRAAASELAERPWLERLRYAATPGEAWLDRTPTSEELLASRFHARWLAAAGLGHFSCGIV